MKQKLYLLFISVFLLNMQIMAQAPEAFNYQGVARDALGAILANQPIGIEFTIHQGSASGTVVYQETYKDTTNQFGLFNIVIGRGTPVTGTFSSIGWDVNAEYLEVGMDPTGGTSYADMGTEQFLSVPYALFAANSGNSTGTAWQLTGNGVSYSASVTPATYVGTTSSGGAGFQFGVGGINAGRVESTNGNTALGYQTLNTNTTGKNNTALGYKADVSSSGLSNATAIGTNAKAIVSNSITLGTSSTGALYLPNYSTVGSIFYTSAANGLVSAIPPGATGQVLQSNGSSAPTWVNPGSSGSSGWQLTGNGVAYSFSASPATYVGTTSSGGKGFQFGVLGVNAGRVEGGNSGGTYNTALGWQALNTSAGSGGNVAIGYESLENNTGSFNVAVGYQTLTEGNSALGNTAIGYGSMGLNTSGGQDVGVGYNALVGNTTGSHNTAVGYTVMTQNIAGGNNTALGFDALETNITGNNNTAVGYEALQAQSVGPVVLSNTAVGANALIANNGNRNVAVGDSALAYNTLTGNNNTAIGYQANVASANISNATALGAYSIVGESNALVLGGTGSNAVNVGIGTTIPSSSLQVSNGNISLPVVVSANSVDLSVSPNTYSVIITATGQTVTLPTASSCTGRVYVIVAQMSSGSITTSSFKNFNGASTTTIAAGNSVMIQSDGTNWDELMFY